MTHQTHKVATDALDTLGTHPIPENSGRDAIHLAVEPAVAGHMLSAGQRVKIDNGFAVAASHDATGIVDPFLIDLVHSGQKFWLVVLPRTITSLRHVWSHPDFPEDGSVVVSDKEASIAWMREWAKKHVSDDYYGDRDTVSDEEAYAFALRAGETTHIGPYEDARDHIDNEWWSHWETITGKPGKRGEYFSCSC
ncbi:MULTISPECIES: hypothetical protein [unclassified Mesorhizobium]|uniref:hypothetical protein n=1 Tax=unclassified Mesorhizobium TaxID=325217 RepID=UPI000FC99E11|nr:MULTISPECIES: hypothetical protein [unclassified Mesorhizobium]TGT97587.1 hypothetical protein EN806_48700 [bacterium M00.F.Ca.ET.163.01.1.1]TGU44652.1 hypothetical protein EN789_21865 [bacterium M00.F.Ca.ET.146.01.1.1]TGW09988.1 hypothetical protein EN788_22315 [Mesorhizobium sp. M2D.F.Ca.ET.145.01.1.1]TGP34045.1 hypothetical protein EN875_012405 [Mesorhizobium sp. M2D.F.Ca.ET.232.01.1.1]TGQ44076.1 hypothetical protein EN863_014600 [Mesorhizobium sp. M00.F.Ca.ET.220.01.1.1]